MSNLNVTIKNKDWRQNARRTQQTFTNPKHPHLGWQRIVLYPKNQAALELLTEQVVVQLRQNQQIQGAPLIHESDKKLSLVFYRHQPLTSFSLNWSSTNTNGEVAEFKVALKSITAASAWIYMLRSVAKREANEGGSKSKIYRLTRARQKRVDMNHALKKLVQIYQPLLSHQLITCEPFDYWRLHCEERSKERLKEACNTTPKKVTLWNSKIASVEPDTWYIFGFPNIRHVDDIQRSLATLCCHPDAANAQVVYWDHDLIDSDGARHHPEFKPKWNPELFAAKDYIQGCFAVLGKRLQAISKNIPSHPSSAFMAITHGLADEYIARFPVILSHIQQYRDDDDDVLEQLQNWLVARGERVESIESAVERNVRKVNYAIAKPSPHVSLIIPTRDALDITRTCVESVLEKTEYENYDIIIVDNGSVEAATLNWFKEISLNPRVSVFEYPHAFNYSAINNFAADRAKGDYICLLNNDTEVINSTWLTEMMRQAIRPNVGCVGAKLYYPDNTIQHAGVILGLWGVAGHAHKYFLRHSEGYAQRLVCSQNVTAVTAACLVVRKSIFFEVGGLNENELTVAFNDVDLCLKVFSAGYANVWTPYAELYHYESKSRGKEDNPEKKRRERGEVNYMKKNWAAILNDDPSYSPCLTRIQEDFGVNLEAR